MVSKQQINIIKQKIFTWCTDDGIFKRHVKDNEKANFHMVVHWPESSQNFYDIIQPKEKEDLIVLVHRILLGDDLIPVIEKLVPLIDIPISIDTQNYEVAKAAVNSGVSIINDITALADERMSKLAAEKGLPVVLMHMQGEPKTMQAEPKYDDIVSEVLSFLLEKTKAAQMAGIDKDKIFIDPGIGFGKTGEHNLLLLKNIDRFVSSGYRVLLGTSRKKFIGDLTGRKDPAQRVFGTAATVALAVAAGVSIVRVHDVAAMADVVKVAKAITHPAC